MFGRKRVYLDAAAGALPNPSSPHEEGRLAREALERARAVIARLVECKGDDVVFTASATEGNALAILGSVRAARKAGSAHVLYHPGAHASVVENVRILEREGVKTEPLTVRDGRVDIEALKQSLRPDTVLVSMDAVCGETGVVWNTRAVRTVLDAARGAGEPRILLHVDASQAPFTEKLEKSHYGADLLVFDGSKLGSRGAGCLIAHRTIPLTPLYGGGAQERALVSGTQNVEAEEIFAELLEEAAGSREPFVASARVERAALIGALKGIEGLVVNEARAQAPQILNLSLPGRDTDYLVALLDEAGFAVSTRSACETDSEEGSRAVLALTGDLERAKATLRISWGSGVGGRDLARFARALRRAVAFVDSAAHS